MVAKYFESEIAYERAQKYNMDDLVHRADEGLAASEAEITS